MGSLDFVLVMDTSTARIELLMEEHGYNQQELADKLGYHFTTISKHLSSERPSDRFLRKLEDMLGWSSRWIRTGKGPKKITNILTESVDTDSSGYPNTSPVNDKSTGSADDKISQLERELQEERIRSLQREKQLLEEINKLLRGRK